MGNDKSFTLKCEECGCGYYTVDSATWKKMGDVSVARGYCSPCSGHGCKSWSWWGTGSVLVYCSACNCSNKVGIVSWEDWRNYSSKRCGYCGSCYRSYQDKLEREREERQRQARESAAKCKPHYCPPDYSFEAPTWAKRATEHSIDEYNYLWQSIHIRCIDNNHTILYEPDLDAKYSGVTQYGHPVHNKIVDLLSSSRCPVCVEEEQKRNDDILNGLKQDFHAKSQKQQEEHDRKLKELNDKLEQNGTDLARRLEEQQEKQSQQQKEYDAKLERERKKNASQLGELKAEQDRQREKHEAEKRRQQKEHARQLKDEKRKSLTKLKNEKSSQRQGIISDELDPAQNEIDKIAAEIKREEDEVHKFETERTKDGHKIIVMVGMTGDGKSSFGNRLCGDMSEDADEGPYKASPDGKSCTKLLKKHIHNGLTVVDCPGWGDTDNKEDVDGNPDVDRAHTNNLCAFLRGCGGINAFVVVRNGTNFRFDAYFQSQLKYMHSLFGDEFWKHLVVVSTRIDKGQPERQFKKFNKAQQMKDDVARLCNGLNKDVAVIPIGLDNYSEALPQFLAVIPSKKFECDSIKSPIDELKQKKAEKVKKKEEIQRRVDKLSNEISRLESQIANTYL